MSTVEEKLNKLEGFITALGEADLLIAYQEYGKAIAELNIAMDLAVSSNDVLKIKKRLKHCQDRNLGIVDLSTQGMRVYMNGSSLSIEEANTIRNSGSIAPVHASRKKRRHRSTIRDAILSALKDNPELKLSQAIEIAKGVKPNTKFGESHLAYYKSILKKLLKTEGKK